VKQKELREEMAEKAYIQSHAFNLEAFEKQVNSLFSDLEENLRGVDAL
jgi:hypothetical protein